MQSASKRWTRNACPSVTAIAALAPLLPLRLTRPSSAEKLTGSDRWTFGKFDEPIRTGDSFVIRPRFPSVKLGAWDDAHHDAALATPSSPPLKHKVIRCASEPLPRVFSRRDSVASSSSTRRDSLASRRDSLVSIGERDV